MNNPKTTRYEFGGPIGAFGMVVFLPILVLWFATCCDATGYPSKNKWRFDALFDLSALFVYVGFVGLLAVLYMVLPGKVTPGTKLRDGSRIRYRLNGKSRYLKGLLAYIEY